MVLGSSVVNEVSLIKSVFDLQISGYSILVPSSNKCIASSNKCLTSSNKKLVETIS